MTSEEFTIIDLRRILREAAGESDGAVSDDAVMDTDFLQLGYESLALLETGSRIEREFGIKLDDSTLFELTTPRALIEAVNLRLAVNEVS